MLFTILERNIKEERVKPYIIMMKTLMILSLRACEYSLPLSPHCGDRFPLCFFNFNKIKKLPISLEKYAIITIKRLEILIYSPYRKDKYGYYLDKYVKDEFKLALKLPSINTLIKKACKWKEVVENVKNL